MRSWFFIFWVAIYLLGVGYLVLTSPSVAELPEALVSSEPGDTWQNPNTKAFFTDWDREKVISYYRESFRLSVFGYPLPNLRLNYRPEDTAMYVRKHIDSYYLEEIVVPFRESLFINGWDPKRSPTMARLSPEELKQVIIVVDGKEFQSKITLRWYRSSAPVRVMVWTAAWLLAPVVSVLFFLNLSSFIKGLRVLFGK